MDNKLIIVSIIGALMFGVYALSKKNENELLKIRISELKTKTNVYEAN